jgi:hypothetical protein
MTTRPPGWYDDGHGAMRWWDGAVWTEHVATPAEEPIEQLAAVGVPRYRGSTAAYPADGGAFIAATEPHKSKLWVVWVVLGVIVLAIVIGLSVLIPVYMMAVPAAVVVHADDGVAIDDSDTSN